MKTKTFLLGSAAAIGFSGASEAAGLPILIPNAVDYVRVCDAFGDGYWYILGTNTCIALGGDVRLEVEWQDPAFTQGDDDGATHDTRWKMKTSATLSIEARAQTDWGPLTSFIEFESDFSDANKSPSGAAEDAFVSLGPFAAGRFQSGFDFGGGYTGAYGLDDGFKDATAATDTEILQLQFSWALGGFGIVLSAEDPSYRSTLNSGSEWYGNSNQGDIPDLVAALTGEWGNISGRIAFLHADSDPVTTWGVQGGLEFTDLWSDDSLLIAASYIDVGGGGGFSGCPLCSTTGEVWSMWASYEHVWTDTLSSQVTARYDDFTSLGVSQRWAFALGTDWEPVKDFLVRVGYRYYENGVLGTGTDQHNGVIEFRRLFEQ